MANSVKSLRDMIMAVYGVTTVSATNQIISQVQTSVTRLCKINPRRVGLVIANNGSNTFYILNRNDVSTTKGIPVGPGGAVSYIWEHDFETLADEWYGIANGAASDCTIYEVIIDPATGEKDDAS